MAQKNNHKVAIIEDDIAINQMYRMKFESEGFEVITAADGEDGLAVIEDEKPDIVLLDLMMPILTGEEVLSAMRGSAWGKNMPVIILTNMGENEAPKSISKNGVLDFIVKAQMTPSEVAAVVKKHLKDLKKK